MKKTPLKRGNSTLKRSKLSPISKNRDLEKEKQENAAIRAKDMEFYLQIWNSRPHFCFESGVPLYIDSFHAHHVLPKEKYPEYRWEPWNIVLIAYNIHDQTHLDINKTPKIHAYYLELMDKYVNFEEKVE